MLHMPNKYIALCDALTGGVQIYEHIEHYQSDYNLNVGHLETSWQYFIVWLKVAFSQCVFPSGNDQQGVGSIIKRCKTDLYRCIKLLLFFNKKIRV